MSIFSQKTTRTIIGISLIFSVSAICGLLLWYQRIFPPQFQLGTKSPIKVINTEERVILDIESTENQRSEAKTKAIIKYLEKPDLLRDDIHNEESLKLLNKRIQNLDDFLRYRDTNIGNGAINNKTKAKLITLPPEALNRTEALNIVNVNWTELKAELEIHRERLKKNISNWNTFASFANENELYNLTLSDWQSIKGTISITAERLLRQGFLGRVDKTTLSNTSGLIEDKQLNALKAILESTLKPNLRIKTDHLNRIEYQAVSNVEPVMKVLPAKAIVLLAGQTITKDKFDIIEQLGLNKREPDWIIFQEAFWMTLLVTLSFWLYVRLEKFKISLRQLLLLSCLTVGASAFVGLFSYNKPAALPLAAVAMTVGLFFKPTVGFSAGTLFGILCLQALGINATIALPSFVGVIVGTILSQKAKNRADLARAGAWLGIAQIIAFIFIAGIAKNIPLTVSEIVIQGLSGLTTGVIVSSLMPYLESLFGVITRFRLLELSDPNQPLLQKLHDEAPGTYEHTLVVADLAQDAAKRIEADYELVRVGILYHDVGKLYNPQIFIENQFGGENPHDKMKPKESAKAIISHVPEGLVLAKKYGLPDPISCFIPTHQGTSRAGHFFLKACQEDPSLKDDNDFRYPGPKPLSKETGIAMLADTVEATIRSLKTDNTHLVKETIQNLIQARIQDNQLSESSLTKEELDRIAESFFESWKNKNHERVRYITDLKK